MTSVKVGNVRFIVCSILLTVGLFFFHSCNYHYDRTPKQEVTTPTGSDAMADQPTAQWLIQKVFAPKCASCHNTGRAAAGVNLTNAEALSGNSKTSTGKSLLNWGSSDTSLLYTITQSGEMPKGSNKLTPVELEVLACFINKGKDAAKMLSACIDLSQTGANDSTTPPPAPPSDVVDDDEDEDDNDDQDNDDDDNPTDPVIPTVTFNEVKEKVFASSCLDCHYNGNEDGIVSLETYESVMNGEKKIVAATCDESPLYIALKDGSMPLGGEKLSPDLLLLLRHWIDGGAKP
jgi:hypothetical protein